jgi:metal-responsive CopG/Arc/MetJ family transcriptional regulator
MKTHSRIGISIPTKMLEDIDSLRKISNRSKFISELIIAPIQLLKGDISS